MAVTAEARRRALAVAEGLAELYPDAHCALHFSSPLELLIATILSAQCTDERVNIVTHDLFRRYRTAADYAEAPIADLEKIIRSAGFYRMKAKNIQGCCRALVEKHGGEVPQDLAALVLLAGVGRKTANVVLGTAFGIPSGVVVDTHVTRLTYRLGLTRETDAVKIEAELMSKLPPEEWIDFSHRLIWHGRKICTARKPLCEECKLNAICPKNGVLKNGVKSDKKPSDKKRGGPKVGTSQSAGARSTKTVKGSAADQNIAAAEKRSSKRKSPAPKKPIAKTAARSRG